jgi:hypothetical protein
MEDGLLKLPEEQDFRDSVDRLFAINRDILYLGTGGEELSGQTLNNILIKILPSRAMIEYIRSRGEELTEEEEILTKTEELDVYLLLCRKVEIQNTKKVQGGETECKKKDESSGTTHESTHLWKDCPDNKFNKQKKKEYKGAKAKKSEEQKEAGIHSMMSNTNNKKTPIVQI